MSQIHERGEYAADYMGAGVVYGALCDHIGIVVIINSHDHPGCKTSDAPLRNRSGTTRYHRIIYTAKISPNLVRVSAICDPFQSQLFPVRVTCHIDVTLPLVIPVSLAMFLNCIAIIVDSKSKQNAGDPLPCITSDHRA